MTTQHDNVEQQKTPFTKLADRSTNKEGCNQVSFKGSQFGVVAEDAQNVCQLLEEIAKYADKYTVIFVPNQDLKGSIGIGDPPPTNIDKTKYINDFFRELLEQKRRNV